MGFRWLRSWWGVFFILNLFLVQGGEATPADLSRPWSCQFSVKMSGNAYEFYRVGFDAWDGLGEVRCKNVVTEESILNEWYFVFRSWSRSTGVDSRNTFLMESLKFEVVHPSFVGNSYFYQTTMTLGSLLDSTHYILNLTGQNARIKVAIKSPSLPSELAANLVSGTLIIGPLPTELNAFR